MPRKITQSAAMKLTQPAILVKQDVHTMLVGGFDHEKVREKIRVLGEFFRFPFSEEYTLLEHKKTKARGIWLEILFVL